MIQFTAVGIAQPQKYEATKKKKRHDEADENMFALDWIKARQ